jgi:hypothetical protein
VVLSWETRAVPDGLLSQSVAGPMPGDWLFAWLLVSYISLFYFLNVPGTVRHLIWGDVSELLSIWLKTFKNKQLLVQIYQQNTKRNV